MFNLIAVFISFIFIKVLMILMKSYRKEGFTNCKEDPSLQLKYELFEKKLHKYLNFCLILIPCVITSFLIMK
jgi:hypothetical protein